MDRFIRIIKRLVPCVIFCLLFVFLLEQLTAVLMPKSRNRYYILEQYLEDNPEHYAHDVQVFGSCHSYTSFDPIYLEARTGVSAFVYGNAGEIIPTTYVRMTEQFKKHTPKVALVEIWGINPYETYDSHKNIFGNYLTKNLERLPFSNEKQEVIADYDDLYFEGEDTYDTVDFLRTNLPIATYKDRFLDESLTDVDFYYSFQDTKPYSSNYIFNEMTSRLTNNGYKKNPPTELLSYPDEQNHIGPGESMEIEPDIVKYILKIIDLCKKNDVELIFYRSPYISKVNELKKLVHMHQICDENGVLFLDLEEELQYNYYTDFLDKQHLSEIGANKSTEFLTPYILDALQEPEASARYEANASQDDLLSALPVPDGHSGHASVSQTGTSFDGWSTDYFGDTFTAAGSGMMEAAWSPSVPGWHLYRTEDDIADLAGKTLTAAFDITGFAGTYLKPTVCCYAADGTELSRASADMQDGMVTTSLVVPENAASLRIGFLGQDGMAAGDHALVNSISLYEGAYTPETLPSA